MIRNAIKMDDLDIAIKISSADICPFVGVILRGFNRVNTLMQFSLQIKFDPLLWCYFCKSWKKKEVFGTDNSRWSGKHSVCRGCNSIKSTKSRYQISRSELEGMRNKPCPICERSGKKMEVDHDHKTKKIREMLCSRCNGALGQFLDNIDLLKKAIKYLKKHNGGK